MYNGVWGKAQEAGGILENFSVRSNLTVCRVTFGCKLQKKIRGAGCTVQELLPNNFVGGATTPSATPVSSPMLVLEYCVVG